MICENLLKSLSSKLSRRRLLRLAAALPLLSKSTAVMAAQQSDKVAATQQRALSRIAFGSCAHQDKDQPIWSDIMASQPELFVFLGDNIYGDSENPEVLAAKYAKLAAKPGFSSLRQQIEVIATWDDHDYGRNDAGRDYPSKEASRKLLLDFFGEPASSERRTRPDGIYTSYLYGESGQKVQVILLDLRWNRSAITRIQDPQRQQDRAAEDRGPYDVSLSAEAELLGERQWAWLEQQLQVEADVRIIGSSIQLLAEFTGWETWANFPKERQRFIELLERYQTEPIVIISGDVHWAEFSRIDETANGWPLLELTSSGITEEWPQISPNRHRVGEAFAVANFGLIEIDWSSRTWPQLTLSAHRVGGDALLGHRISFNP